VTAAVHPAIEANNLGLALYQKGMFQHAESSYRRAISLVPAGAYAEAHNNLGILLQTTGRTGEAAIAYRRAMEVQPNFSRAASNLGCVAEELGRYEDAIKLYRHALAIEPAIGVIWHNLAGIYRELSRFDEAYECYEKTIALDPKNAAAHASLVYTRDMDPRTTREESAAVKARWHAAHAIKAEPAAITDPDPDRRIRVGYVSGDFRLHSVAFAFANVLFGHDRRKFEVFCYSTTMREDPATERFRESVDHWTRIIGLTDEVAAQRIRDDKIDILVDLSGYTAGNRLPLFTMRPAPIQLHAWGYLNGVGIPEIPHTILDAALDPASAHLPCVFHYRAPEAPAVAPLPARKNGHITFGYLGRWSKVTAEVAAVWCDVMQAIPSAKMVIKDKTFGQEEHRQRARDLLGLPADRVETLVQNGHYPHLADHGRIDIGLDPWPTNGGVSTLEALWMGVPVLTLPGDRPSGRVGASVMTTLGLPGFVARDRDDYVLKAVALANKVQLAELRAGMRERMKKTVIGDAGLYVAHLERAYRRLWVAACQSASH
jgi:predicted O-linked N-acetylglucosamine transferase (SPINDLY family)